MLDSSKRLSFFLPNFFTALNMACGYASVINVFAGRTYLACMFLLLGAIFDSVDGRIARLTGTQSAFGEQFDSISDVVSFGMAPALLFHQTFLSEIGRGGTVLCFLFLLCGALRLARFNANIDKITSSYFQGLPIPAAAMAIIGMALLSTLVPGIKSYTPMMAGYIAFYSFLMISNIPFHSFKKSDWVKTHKKLCLFILFLAFASIFTYEEVMIFAWVSVYVLGSLIYFVFHKGELKNVFTWGQHENEDQIN